MDFLRFIFKKNSLYLLIAFVVFYLFRTSVVDLTNHNQIKKIIIDDLRRTYLSSNLTFNLSEDQKSQLEQNEISINKISGRYSASKLVTTELYLKVLFRFTPESNIETKYFQLRFDPINNKWAIFSRYKDGLVWNIAI